MPSLQFGKDLTNCLVNGLSLAAGNNNTIQLVSASKYTCIQRFQLLANAKVKSVERHLHALMCSVSDHPPSCE